jgi:biotin carboxyl carrier protein
MGDIFKVSGKKVEVPSQRAKKWKFTKRPGGWIIAESEEGERVRFSCFEAQGNFSASIHGKLWFGQWSSQNRASAQSGAQAENDLVAQFPGKVRKILVKAGDQVAEGDSLLLVEAMKMEFAIRAPFSGRVSELLVHEGQQLTPGTQFLHLKGDNGEAGK